MADATLAIANAILKEDYLGPLRKILNTATPVFSRLAKNTRDIVGKEAWIPVEMELTQGAGARGENETLPTPLTGQYQELKATLKYYYGTLSVTGPAIRQTSKGDKGSFGRIMDFESKGLKRTLGLVLAHDFYAGDTLGTTTDGAAGTTVTMDPAVRPYNMEWFHNGMLVDVYDAAGTVLLAGAQAVSALDKAAGTFTIPTSIDTDGGQVYRAGTKDKAVTSLEDIIKTWDDVTGSVYGVSQSVYSEWGSTVDAHNAAFTVTDLQQNIDATVVKSGKMPTALISDYTLQRRYFETLTANPRYMSAGPTPEKMSGGFRSLEYSGGGAPIPWIADRLAPAGTIYGLHEPDLQVFSPGEFSFIEVGGDVWLPDIYGATGKDIYKAVLYRDMELGAFARNSHFKMTGVT